MRKILAAVFSIETGLSQEAERAMYMRALRGEPNLRGEIEAAFNDPNVKWAEMLFNRNYEVYESDSEDEALSHARQLLLDPILELDGLVS